MTFIKNLSVDGKLVAFILLCLSVLALTNFLPNTDNESSQAVLFIYQAMLTYAAGVAALIYVLRRTRKTPSKADTRN